MSGDKKSSLPYRLYKRAELPGAIEDLYSTDHGTVGGCLHIVLDDGNTEANHVAWCADYAVRKGCTGDCFNIALSLLALPSRAVRNTVIAEAFQ